MNSEKIMRPEEIKRIDALTYLCSLEVLRDDFKAALREQDESKAIRIVREVKQYSAKYLKILEGKQ